MGDAGTRMPLDGGSDAGHGGPRRPCRVRPARARAGSARTGRQRLHFVSSNARKLDETVALLRAAGIRVVPTYARVEELQTHDPDRLIRDKALKAYAHVGQPVFVDHTMLALDWLGGLPGSLTPVLWQALGAQRFGELCAHAPLRTARAVTCIGFIDGRRFHAFRGAVEGRVVTPARGDPAAQWECLFAPEGRNETFGELGALRGGLCMRARALAAFSGFLAAHSWR
jgi:XTP/dITP diphosphohydrolase